MNPKKSIKSKIVILFISLSLILTFGFSYASYKIVQKEMHAEYRDRIIQTAELGAEILDKSLVKSLTGQFSADLTEDESKVQKIENSNAYQNLSRSLNFIRDSKALLIKYVYIWAAIPTAAGALNPKEAYYVCDADVLSLNEQKAKGKEIGEISNFGTVSDISMYPAAIEAFKTGKSVVEKELSYDSEFKTYSITGYAPIKDNQGKLLAILGIDMTDKNIQEALRSSTSVSIIIGAIFIFVATLASLFFGNIFVEPLLKLNRAVLRFGEKEFSVRSEVISSDEIGTLSSNFNQMAETIVDYDKKMKDLIESLQRFVPFEFLEFLEKKSITDVALGQQVSRNMTIFFCDIRSFTSLSENLTPKETFNFINSYLSRMGPVIRENHGFIDKYIGDAIMAIFPEQTDYAVQAAIKMRSKVKEYNIHRANNGYAPVRIGIGIHTGLLMLGTIGEVQRMETTVIADTVNLASRLEGLTKQYKSDIIISQNVKDGLKFADQYNMRFLGHVQVVGKKEIVPIYEVFDEDQEDSFRWKKSTQQELYNAIQHYIAGDLEAAYKILKQLYRQNNDDEVVRIYIKRIQHYRNVGKPENWNGSDKIRSK